MKVSPHPLRRRSASARAAGVLLLILMELGLSRQPISGGDILRGGASSGQPAGTVNPAGTAAPTITPTGGNTRDSLARTASAIQAMQALQKSARDVATGGANHAIKNPSGKGSVLPDVPDGLGKGGLQVDSGVATNPDLWTGAGAPSQTVGSDGKVIVTIQQTAQQALLNWETFNVGKNTTLKFDQSTFGGANVGQYIAFNKVNDPMANPSQILGSIQAEGQVYVMNRNGIVFGGSSQVNVHALVASTLTINESLVKQGLLNNPTNQFLFSGLGGDANTKVGDVVVEAGAQLTAPTNSAKVGGRIALVGANVINEGTITTTDGQTILAAGLEVGFSAHATSDPSLRGLDTFVGAVVDPASSLSAYAGTVTNSGIIDAGRANVTMAGKNVQQLGAITSTTSVAFNGRIDLLANYDALGNVAYDPTLLGSPTFLNRSVGTVTLGEGSITQILPELSSTEKAIGSTLALRSQVNLQGQEIHFDDNSILYAPNANVTVDAGSWYVIPATQAGQAVTYSFLHSGGRIDLDSGALIDVSGSKNVQASATSNIVAVELRGSELADSPLLRDGALRGQTIYVDITETGTYNGKTWIGTPLADVSGYANLVQRSVGELTAAGGTVNLNAGDAVVIRNGAKVDVSGGTIDYAGGVVQTSRVISADGKIFDVSDATPDRVYNGVYLGGSVTTSTKWGITEQYVNPLTLNGTRYQEGYTQGGNGGTLAISSGSVAVDGTLKGTTYTGVRQRTIGPVASTLNINFSANRILNGEVASYSPNATDVIFSNSNAQENLADFALDSSGNPEALPAERIDKLILSGDLLGKDGFGNLSIKSPDGDVTVEKGVTLETAPRGSISLSGANIDIQGSVISAGGTLSFTAYDISPDEIAELRVSNGQLPALDPTRGHFTLGEGSVLSTAGYLVDDRPTSSTLLKTPLVTTGGSITVTSLSADLSTGSLIDVSGGVVATAAGKYTYGNAGTISLLTGKDATLKGVTGGELHLGGELRGMSGAKGGTLNLQAAAVQVGGASAPQGVLHLDSDFFNQGGFASFAVNGIGKADGAGMLITSDARISPVISSWLASEVNGAISLDTYVKDAGLRSTASLSFGAIGSVNDLQGNRLILRGDTKVESGAVIDAGPAGAIKVSGQTVEIQGSLLAAGGSIQVNGDSKLVLPNNADPTEAGTTVWIGSNAVLNASGTTLLVPDSYGRRRGAVLDGGTIKVSGNIVADAGSVLDVSGTSGTLDLLAGESGQSLADLIVGSSGTTSKPYSIRGKSTKVDSDGGTITLSGSEMLFSDATLIGKSGGSSASGGTLAVSSGAFLPSGAFKYPNSPTLVVVQSGDVVPDSFTSNVGVAGPQDSYGISGGGRFAIDRFSDGGFTNLDLGGVIKAVGPVAIQANGRVTLGGTSPVLYADSTLSVDASYVVLGNTFKTPRQAQDNQEDYLVNGVPVRMPATYGSGSLSVSADLIDVGDLSLQGIGSASLTANHGDIRGSGTLAIAGDLSLTAGQIYPPTALKFTIAAFDYTSEGVAHTGSVTINKSGTRSLPLSAGGTLAIYGSKIVQNGTLRAPFGNIILGWDGTGTAPTDLLTGGNFSKTTDIRLGAQSVTSVSAIDPITGKGITIPYGVSIDGTTWLDPAGNDITNGGLPQKSITLSGESVVSDAGSQVDIRGGGDLFAYRFVAGNGGSTDILASSGSFAIIPGYGADYAPYAPFSKSGSSSALGGDAGYVNAGMTVGQQVYLDGSMGLPAGIYTLLPARYALLPGAYLVTPQSGAAGTVQKADGSKIVSGHLLNGLENGVSAPAVSVRFEVASSKVVNARAEYTQLLANKFLTSTGGFRLPGDSGQLVLSATRAMAIGGEILSVASGNFRGGLIDISSAGNILITNGSSTSASPGTLVLDANLLSGFGAESILIGGVRSADEDGTLVSVTTGTLTLDNAGAALVGPEIVLAAKDGIDLKAGSQIKQSGTTKGNADTLIIGNQLASGAAATGSGNGALVRVNHGNTGSLIRRDVIAGQNVSLTVGSGATLSGDSLLLDSTGQSVLGAGASLSADNLSLSSGRISLSLDPSVTPGADAGLVLSSAIISDLSSASSLSLASYSSIDLLGSGTVGGTNAAGKPVIDSLALRAAAIRGIGVGGGSVEFNASNIELSGQAGAVAPDGPAESSGVISFRSENLSLGANALAIRGFSQTNLTGTKEIRTVGDGSLATTGDLNLSSPVLISGSSVDYAIASSGALKFSGAASTGTLSTAGLASSLSLTGSSVDLSSRIVMPSGIIVVKATTGDVKVSGSLEAGGVSRRFKDQIRYTDAGSIKLTADAGNVTLASGGSLNVSAAAGGGDAGSISISAKNGSFDAAGSLAGKGGTGGEAGSFSLQVNRLPSLAAFDALLDAASFTQSRDYRITTGDVVVDGTAHAHSYSVSTDSGSISVTGTIDASGVEGGSVRLVANQNLTLADGSLIDVSADKFSSAGKGGTVDLETRGAAGGVLNLVKGSNIDLSVAENTDSSAKSGDFTGVLHLRAPRLAGGSDVAIGSLSSAVSGASQIIVEGYQTYDLTSTNGDITKAVQNQVKTDATAFVGNADAIEARLLAENSPSLGSIVTVRPGAEIINSSGNLTLGATNASAAAGDWDLSTFRFGAEQVPGLLTLRASGDLIFYNTLSDGFTASTYPAGLMANSATLADNAESWSYRLVAGADFSAADTRQVKAQTLAANAPLGSAAGSIRLGKNAVTLRVSGGNSAQTSQLLNSTSSSPGYFQVIRTGSGDIDLVAGGDIQLRNAFASIYTAGTQVSDPTLGGTFSTPINAMSGNIGTALGSVQQIGGSPVQYTLGGGNVTLTAGNDIIHLTQATDPQTGQTILVEDSQREMPVNWLYRRGYVNAATGEFGTGRNGDLASTSWWVDFTNFFQSTGALGGGDVTLTAGRDVSNVDAVAPTNARMPSGKPDATKLVELGGGDVTVTAGRNINAGVYYVERGQGTLTAGASIITNATRSPSTGIPGSTVYDSETWLPTTLFVGKGAFDVSAGADVLLGPVANVFLLPQGLNNSFWNKSWFSTYSQDSGVTVSSTTGDIEMRQAVVLPSASLSTPTLQAWFSQELLLSTSSGVESASAFQPWLRLTETSVDPFSYAFDLMPGTVKLNAFGGSVNIVGNMTLSPSSKGTLEILAANAVNGFQSGGLDLLGNRAWLSSTINLSDADPSALPGIATPFGYQQIAGTVLNRANRTETDFLASIVALFNETGSTDGALQERQIRHTAGLLHAGDADPLRIYSESGDISGFTLYSSKFARVLSGQDLRDISLYLQNNAASNVSVVAAARDIIAYDAGTDGRVTSRSVGNTVAGGTSLAVGDIQIAGEGALEVFAGRNLDLGIGASNADGTGSGITSVGNGRNPYLPFAGAEVIAAAGFDATSLDTSKADFAAFITKFVKTEGGTAHLKELGLTQESFDGLATQEEKDQVALQVFYLVLRDTGRNYNNPDSEFVGTYAQGKDAVATLFPGTEWNGNIETRSRSIRTRNGGDITLMAPGGSLRLAQTVIGSPLVPPGIITEAGGNISIFTDQNVDLGISRIFTLRGGNEIIWSTHGDIAAGSSSKTIQSAPPTRVLIDPQSGDVKTDLAGLATGGGIGVLSTVAGVKPSDVDLIAPEGTVDAGDAGIRVSGNINIAAAAVVNSGNISVGGSSSGTSSAVAAPSVTALTAASNSSVNPGVTETTQEKKTPDAQPEPAQVEAPSDISVEVIGYGGDEGSSDEDEEDKDKAGEAQGAANPEGN